MFLKYCARTNYCIDERAKDILNSYFNKKKQTNSKTIFPNYFILVDQKANIIKNKTDKVFISSYPFEINITIQLKEQMEADSIQNLSVQLELVIDLLFMMDLSHLLASFSKEFQRFDVAPFYAMNMYWQ